HTPGGLVLASEQIACALKRHEAKVTVFVPHYAMSGGTLIALAADEIVMDPNAVLGPVDPQIGTMHGQYPAASILKALEEPNPNRDDETLILGDVARKAINQVYQVIFNLVWDKMSEEKAKELATTLSEGRWTHDFPLTVEMARELGLPVREGLPDEIYELMDLYPQPLTQRPSVEYIPLPYRPHRRPSVKE
ncbi:MAG: SDH family Clp fold serine proteinase, partial [Candidatus Caldatribacteriaceae bacterium]